MSDLRNKLIRLAHEKPELRGYLLPLLKEASRNEQKIKSFIEDEIEAQSLPRSRAIDKLFNEFGDDPNEFISRIYDAERVDVTSDEVKKVFRKL